jgi:ribosome maturation factor RimP
MRVGCAHSFCYDWRDKPNVGEAAVEKAKLLELIREGAEPMLEEMGYELVDMEFVKEGSNWYLRLYIDKERGVDLEDCERASRSLSALLDRKDWISVPYFLEVSSPGIERTLKRDKDWIRFNGALVNVHLFAAMEGRKVYQGALGEVSDRELCLNTGDGEIRLPRDQIALVRLAWEA